ncbi:MAG: phosphatidylglycerophosphatase A [Gammaproteobacteria bacterium]|nr:MAG: phosphatidylglycerophosphatase A [Gammaproteobacteria bacterium]
MSPRQLLGDPLHLLALGLGTGCLPKAPGTFGSLVALPLYLLLEPLPPALYIAAVSLLLVAGIPLCGRTARALGEHDHPAIVWDEVVGMLVTLTLAPSGWPWLLAGFLLFRLFDVLKPWPISVLDRNIGGGAGIMLDDVAAGVAAFSCLQLFRLISDLA